MTPIQAHRRTRQIVNMIDDLVRYKPEFTQQLQADRRHFERQLENKEIIPPPFLRRLGFRFDLPRGERKALLGVDHVFQGHARLERMLSEQYDASHTAEWTFRIAAANSDLMQKGYWPFMVTLTLDPSLHPDGETFWSSRGWEHYLRKLASVAGRELGFTAAESRNRVSDLVKYVAVIEHGKSREHHHTHALIWLKAIPQSWKVDPNLGRVKPDAMQCLEMNSFWEHGFAYSKYFRFVGDPWSQLGFVIPIKEDGSRFVLGPVESAGRYVMKYMQKETKEWRHRIRASSSLGLRVIQRLMSIMTDREIDQLTRRIENFDVLSRLQEHISIPVQLIRRLSKQVKICRDWSTSTRHWMNPRASSFLNMLKSVRDGQRPWEMLSSELHEWFLRQNPPQEIGFSEVPFWSAYEKLACFYPRCEQRPTYAVGGV